MKRTLLLTGLLAFLAGPAAKAQDAFSAGYLVGDKAESFNLKNVDGKMVSLSDFASAKGFVLVFTCNTCPYSQAYEGRINALHQKYAGKGYPVLAINPNDPSVSAGDSFKAMQERASAQGFQFPYLFDEGQQVSRLYGPLRTPHVYVLEKTGNGNVVRYIGAIDNDTEGSNPKKISYVEQAVDALIKGGKPEPATTKAIGCGVKWGKS